MTDKTPTPMPGMALRAEQDISDTTRYTALEIDYALYESYLENTDLTAEQKREFIETLWQIIVAFVDLGFGVHPMQLAGQAIDISKQYSSIRPQDMLDLNHIKPTHFEKEPDGPTSPGSKGV